MLFVIESFPHQIGWFRKSHIKFWRFWLYHTQFFWIKKPVITMHCRKTFIIRPQIKQLRVLKPWKSNHNHALEKNLGLSEERASPLVAPWEQMNNCGNFKLYFYSKHNAAKRWDLEFGSNTTEKFENSRSEAEFLIFPWCLKAAA